MNDSQKEQAHGLQTRVTSGTEPSSAPYLRLIVLTLIAVSTVAASVWLFGTASGRQFLDREYLRQFGESLRGWVADHVLLSLLILVAAYVVCAILLLPVWWLQMLAGLAAGIGWGLAAVMFASTCGALATAVVSKWLGEAWVRSHIIGRQDRAGALARILDLVGRQGLLVVFICRLSYPVPYGVSNYLFGLTGVGMPAIAVGTALGGIPIYAGWVAAGAKPEWIGRWEFWTLVVGVNLSILVPLLIWSLKRKPEKHGVSP